MENLIAVFPESEQNLMISNAENQSDSRESKESFESNRATFMNLPRTKIFSDYLSQFQSIALHEGWDVLAVSLKRDSESNMIESFMIRCFMHDKNSKRAANQKINPERNIKSTKTNCLCRFSIKLVQELSKNGQNLHEFYYAIASCESSHNHAKNIGIKVKLTDEIERWVKENIDPRIYGPISLQRLLFKQFKMDYSQSQLSYLLHKLFHKKADDVQFLIKEILQKNADLQYKIGLDQVHYML